MDSSSKRVRPMSFVGFQGAGKSRMLKELSKKLREEGIPAIFISFGDETDYDVDTEGASTPLADSLNLRLAWAAATDDARARVARAANVDVDKLNFTMWLEHASINERTAYEWLNHQPCVTDNRTLKYHRQPCVLLIDDLNRFATVKRGERSKAVDRVGAHLRCEFLNEVERHIVFAEPNNVTTVSDGRSLLEMLQKRHLLRPELPFIKENDLEQALKWNVTRGAICWAGRSPGLVWEMCQHGGSLEARVGRVSSIDQSTIFEADAVLCDVVLTAMEGMGASGYSRPHIGNWSTLLNVFDEERTSYNRRYDYCHLLPPCYLAGMCASLAQWDALKEKVDESFCEGLNAVASSLRMLNHAEDGHQWAGPCTAAVLMRLLQGELKHLLYVGVGYFNEIPPQVGTVLPDSLIVPLKWDEQAMGCKFGGYFSSSEWSNTEDVVKAFAKKYASLPSAKPGCVRQPIVFSARLSSLR